MNIMKKAFLFCFVFLLYAVSFTPAEVHFDYKNEALQGQILPVYLFSDEKIENISLSLNRNNKTYGKYRGFLLKSEDFKTADNNNFCYTVLVSVSSDAVPDDYSLDIRWISDGYAVRKIEKLTVKKRDFRHEDITLSKGLTTLRKDESERRKRETRAIIKLYSNFNTEDQFADTVFTYPMKGNYPVTSFFGDRRNFIYEDGSVSKSLHNGIDFAAVKGTPVYSSGRGKVVFSGNRLITGNSIIIEHIPGFYSVYYHLDKIFAETDKIVEKGEKIGEVGSSGISTGNHLHWEVRNQGIAVDPEQFIDSPLIDKRRIISIIKMSFSDIDRGR